MQGHRLSYHIWIKSVSHNMLSESDVNLNENWNKNRVISVTTCQARLSDYVQLFGR